MGAGWGRVGRMTRTYLVLLYHDEPQEAAADVGGSGTFPKLREAVAAARSKIGDYWQTASVHRGWWHEATRRSPGWFEYNEQLRPLRVGADWIER